MNGMFFGVMAAHCNKFIRLRLFFDYPPPAVVGCRMCWLLVDLNTCRVVADLESVIREKFEFSRSSILRLFIEDCYLPHTESIYVVRDNDNVRVKVECLPQVNGHSSCPETAAVSCKKRQRDTAEGPSVEHKKKKKKRNELEDGTGDGSDVAKGDNGNKMLEIKMAVKKKKKKKKRTVKSVDRSHPAVPEAAAAAAASDIPSGPDKTPAGKVKTQNGPSSGPSRNGNKACHQKVAKKPSTSPAASMGVPHQKPIPEKSRPSFSPASSQTDSSSDEADTLKVPARARVLHPDTSGSKAAAQDQNEASSAEQPPLNRDSEEEIQLVIRRPQQPLLNIPGPGAWRGFGRGRGRGWAGGDPGESPRVRGQSDVERFGNGTKEPSYQTDSLSNKSVVLQTEAEPVPKDYSSMPLLAAPPQVGQKIAFKLLELTENYTPEVSEYKEGKIINFDPTTKQIELELLNASQAPAEPGKFDLVYQNPDGSERVEYAIHRGSSVMEHWDSLLEPRLII